MEGVKRSCKSIVWNVFRLNAPTVGFHLSLLQSSFAVLHKVGIYVQLLIRINLEWLLVEYILINATLYLS